MRKELLKRIYARLDAYYGDLRWWPGRTALEVIVGAILTQNTAWSNVETCLCHLKGRRMLSLAALRKVPAKQLAPLIRSSGYYNQKSAKLKNFVHYLDSRYAGSLARLGRGDLGEARSGLLSVNGIGPETADSILLYAFGRPVFVVDAYTRRILKRHGALKGNESYDEIRESFEKGISDHLHAYPAEARGRNRGNRRAMIFNQYHALFVNLGKDFCRSRDPRCTECPLKGMGPCRW
jgi:endonuclease-3 related protein